jgi:hypothetical protein
MRVVLLAVIALALPPDAHAISNHVVASKPRVVKKGGKPAAWKFKVVLKSEGLSVARIGLGRTKVSAPLRSDPGRIRALLATEDKSFIALKLDEIAGLAATAAREIEVTIPYGKDLQPGDELDVFTSWRGDSDKQPTHFFGVFQGTGVTTITLPAADAK